MKLNHMKWLPITLLIAALSAATQVNAQSFGNGGPRMDRPDTCVPGGGRGLGQRQEKRGGMRDPGMHLLRISGALALSDAQESTILELSQQFRKDLEAHRTAMDAAMQTLREVRESDGFDEAALREALDVLHPVRVEGMVLRESYRHALDDLLTEVQKAKLEEREFGRGKQSKGRGPASNMRGPRGGQCKEGRGLRA